MSMPSVADVVIAYLEACEDLTQLEREFLSALQPYVRMDRLIRDEKYGLEFDKNITAPPVVDLSGKLSHWRDAAVAMRKAWDDIPAELRRGLVDPNIHIRSVK